MHCNRVTNHTYKLVRLTGALDIHTATWEAYIRAQIYLTQIYASRSHHEDDECVLWRM